MKIISTIHASCTYTLVRQDYKQRDRYNNPYAQGFDFPIHAYGTERTTKAERGQNDQIQERSQAEVQGGEIWDQA